jgi:hypothetical protein
MQLELDELDYAAVQEAIARRQAYGVWPDHDGSNLAGLAVAEICRAYLDYTDQLPVEEDED